MFLVLIMITMIGFKKIIISLTKLMYLMTHLVQFTQVPITPWVNTSLMTGIKISILMTTREPNKNNIKTNSSHIDTRSQETVLKFVVCIEVEDLTKKVDNTLQEDQEVIINGDAINGELQFQTFQSFSNGSFQLLTLNSSEFIRP